MKLAASPEKSVSFPVAAVWHKGVSPKPESSWKSARTNLRLLIAKDAELSEIFMRAFILRRLMLITKGFGDVVVLGSMHCGGTLRLREFLSRNGHPYTYVDLDTDEQAQAVLDRFNVTLHEIPVLICRGSKVLRNPTPQEVADCLGLNNPVDESRFVM